MIKKDEAIKMLFDALLSLYKEAAEYEQDNTPKLSQALNKASRALNKKTESNLD